MSCKGFPCALQGWAEAFVGLAFGIVSHSILAALSDSAPASKLIVY